MSDQNQFYNCDCITGSVEHLPDNCVDLMICDPPYGIQGDRLDKHYNRDETHVIDGYVEVPSDQYPEFSRAWISEAVRVLRPGGTLYVVSGYTNLRHVLNALAETTMRELNHIVWKYNFGVYTSRKFVSSHYHILFYVKPGGRHTFNTYARFGNGEVSGNGGSSNYRDREDVWVINRKYKPGQTKNKNELPEELLIKLIQYSSNQGDLVADFFLGGFSTAKVAIGLGRRATGFEISKRAFDFQVEQCSLVRPGYLLQQLPSPEPPTNKNSGKPIPPDLRENVKRRYAVLRRAGKTQKGAIDELSSEFDRGYWSIKRLVRDADPLDRAVSQGTMI